MNQSDNIICTEITVDVTYRCRDVYAPFLSCLFAVRLCLCALNIFCNIFNQLSAIGFIICRKVSTCRNVSVLPYIVREIWLNAEIFGFIYVYFFKVLSEAFSQIHICTI